MVELWWVYVRNCSTCPGGYGKDIGLRVECVEHVECGKGHVSL